MWNRRSRALLHTAWGGLPRGKHLPGAGRELPPRAAPKGRRLLTGALKAEMCEYLDTTHTTRHTEPKSHTIVYKLLPEVPFS